MDIKRMPLKALEDFKADIECALIRAEVNENIEMYTKKKNRLREVEAEIERRKEDMQHDV